MLSLLLLLVSPVAAQAPAIGEPAVALTAQDTATLYVAVATHLADSIATWSPEPRVTLLLPAFPRDLAMQQSLSRAISHSARLRACFGKECAKPSGYYLVLGVPVRPDSYRVEIGLTPPQANRGYSPPDWSGWLWQQALSVGILPGPSTVAGGGCISIAKGLPSGFTLEWTKERGWASVRRRTALALCA